MPVEKTINVHLGENSYDIFIGKDLGTFLEEWILRVYPGKRVYVIIDRSFHDIYEEDVRQLFKNIPHETYPLDSGEERKNLEHAKTVYAFLLKKACDRESLIVAFGGGIIGDVAGFCAATFMRGVDFIQIPTTLLAQVDSSVGGKTGINFMDAKNIIGAFNQPRGVFVDVKYLSTLDDRNFMSGLAEVLKVGFVSDKEIIESVKGKTVDNIRSDSIGVVDLVTRSVQFKVKVVSEDEKEAGLRKVLNFGHTVGHGIEEATSYKEVLHGEAIAAGMAVETQISLLVGACTEETRNRAIGILEDLGYEILFEFLDYSKVFSLLARDKKRISDTIVAPVLTDIGSFVLKTFQLKEYEKYAAESLNFLKGFKEAKLGKKLKTEIFDDLEVLESSGRFNDAENLVMKYIEKDPENEKLHVKLARLYLRQKKNIDALKVIEDVLEINPGNKEVIALRRDVEDELEKTPRGEREEIEDLVPVDMVIRVDDEIYRIEGVEETEEIVEEEAVVSKEEEIAPAFPTHGEREAEYILEEESESEVPVYTIAMAEILLKEGQKSKALDVLEEMIQNDPTNKSAIHLREKILPLMKREEVLLRYREILERFLQKITEAYK